MTQPLTFVCWKWKPSTRYRSQFGPGAVLALKRMIATHYRREHRFVCVTDDPTGLEGVETFPLWTDLANVPNPSGAHNPSCYRRLKAFSAEAEQWFGPRFVSMDLDTVVVADITTLFDRDEDFVIWGESDFPNTTWYNGSLWLLRAGTRTRVWTEFDPARSPHITKLVNARGSDQGWISYLLGPNEATFGKDDGIFSYRKDVVPRSGVLPKGARVICFHGHVDPWMPEAQRYEWVIKHWGKAS